MSIDAGRQRDVAARRCARRSGSGRRTTAGSTKLERRVVRDDPQPEVGLGLVPVRVGGDLLGRPQRDRARLRRPGWPAGQWLRSRRGWRASGRGREDESGDDARRLGECGGTRRVLPRRQRRAANDSDERTTLPGPDLVALPSAHEHPQTSWRSPSGRGRRATGWRWRPGPRRTAALLAMADALLERSRGGARRPTPRTSSAPRRLARPPTSSTGCGSPRTGWRRWPRGCATSPGCPTRSARWCAAAPSPTGSSCARCGCRSAWSG